MAIETKLIGSYTEIYVGGGNFLTQSAPTNFHQFYTRKILTKDENVEDYREVTAKERATIEATDAAATPAVRNCLTPIFESASTKLNESTGYYEHGSLKDLTEADVAKSWRYANTSPSSVFLARERLRVYTMGRGMTGSLQGFDTLEYFYCELFGFVNYMFSGCKKLQVVYGTAQINSTLTDTFKDCYALRRFTDLRIKSNVTVNLQDSPLLELDTMSMMITKAGGNNHIVVHPEIYAKLNDETNQEWHQLLIDASDKNITFGTA